MGNDVLILTIYFLVVIYVLYQMALSVESSLEDKLRIVLDLDFLKAQAQQQLERQSPAHPKITSTVEQLQFRGRKMPPYLVLNVASPHNPSQVRKVMVTVGPMGNMSRRTALTNLTVSVSNGTDDAQVYIDWDNSSITVDKTRQTQRVFRAGIPISSDLSRSQIFSVVNPGEKFDSRITGEGCLSLDPESNTLQPRRPLVNMGDLIELLADPIMAPDDENDLPQTLAYSLQLRLGVRHITDQQDSNTTYLLLPFEFIAILLPDEIAFPPLRWLLNRPRPENARDALTSLLLGRSYRR
ncbi:hypothetical protein [Leptothoe kymatousa]|uniref:Uncharacterized protein n=1 Tax=Leptothoe kymatousa TAU-MAC 1615 TaxID=2364775 RepID=A0ABS5Y0S4_9CYAN|nr:hypothetical protein [Leptothoe kymatousa]MBT9311411.1 hypothetical protein [Leptothoe kymatousa TAU-MAC 1615]